MSELYLELFTADGKYVVKNSEGKIVSDKPMELKQEAAWKLEQAETNAGEHTPLLVFKRNRSKTYVSMEINDLIKILNDKEK